VSFEHTQYRRANNGLHLEDHNNKWVKGELNKIAKASDTQLVVPP